MEEEDDSGAPLADGAAAAPRRSYLMMLVFYFFHRAACCCANLLSSYIMPPVVLRQQLACWANSPVAVIGVAAARASRGATQLTFLTITALETAPFYEQHLGFILVAGGAARSSGERPLIRRVMHMTTIHSRRPA